MFNGIPPYDIAILLESSSPNNRAIIWQLIDENLEGEILSNLSDEVREMILSFMKNSLEATDFSIVGSKRQEFNLGKSNRKEIYNFLSHWPENQSLRHNTVEVLLNGWRYISL